MIEPILNRLNLKRAKETYENKWLYFFVGDGFLTKGLKPKKYYQLKTI
jgi:hypothetical protein